MNENKLDVTLLLSVLTLIFSVLGLLLMVYHQIQAGQEPIRRSFQNDNVLRRGKYASRPTQWPLK